MSKFDLKFIVGVAKESGFIVGSDGLENAIFVNTVHSFFEVTILLWKFADELAAQLDKQKETAAEGGGK